MFVGFADAEGQGDRGLRYDSMLVTTVMTTSKVIIFNWRGATQKQAMLSLLGAIAEAARALKVGSSADVGGGAAGGGGAAALVSARRTLLAAATERVCQVKFQCVFVAFLYFVLSFRCLRRATPFRNLFEKVVGMFKDLFLL